MFLLLHKEEIIPLKDFIRVLGLERLKRNCGIINGFR